MKQILIFFALTVLVLIPFFIWGDAWMERFTFEGAVVWLREYGAWAWLAGIILLVLDIFLPIPATLVMSGLGFVYGTVVGGLFAGCGSFISGAVGYWICRSFGVKGARRILGEKDLEKGTRTFEKIGGWLVVVSRWMPVFPEVISCMAGLNRMPKLKFHLALLASAIPMGFIYAYIGAAGINDPAKALIWSAVVPPVIWLALTPIFKWQKKRI